MSYKIVCVWVHLLEDCLELYAFAAAAPLLESIKNTNIYMLIEEPDYLQK